MNTSEMFQPGDMLHWFRNPDSDDPLDSTAFIVVVVSNSADMSLCIRLTLSERACRTYVGPIMLGAYSDGRWSVFRP